MRKLEKQMNFALSNKANWAGSNTTVSYNDSTNCSSVYLHGHQIADRYGEQMVEDLIRLVTNRDEYYH